MKQEIIEKICKKNENWLICTRDEINYIVKECMNEYAKEQLILNGVSRSKTVDENNIFDLANEQIKISMKIAKASKDLKLKNLE